MKHFSKIVMLVMVLASFTGIASAQSKKVMEEREKVLAPFPKAEAGMEQHVIFLKAKSDESLFKVEIIPGKVMNVDCNQHILMGKLEEKDLSGWGYTYYEFTTSGQTRSTMMACNEPNKDRFISSETVLVRYNSKLPIVIYAPKGYEINYRIWKANKMVASSIR